MRNGFCACCAIDVELRYGCTMFTGASCVRKFGNSVCGSFGGPKPASGKAAAQLFSG